MTPHMNNKPKPVVHPKIFNVNILILVQEALGNKKIPMAMSCGGGAWWATVARGLLHSEYVSRLVPQ